MKNSNSCPKCGGTDVIRIPGQVGPFGDGNNIAIGMTTMSSITVTRYLCGKCGFSEEWIDGSANIQKVKEKYGDA